MVTTFADQYGWVAYVAAADEYNQYCPYTWSGKTAFGPTIQQAPPPVHDRYLPAGRLVDTPGVGGYFMDIDVVRDGVVPDRPTGYAWIVTVDGRVSSEVRRLVLHWSDHSAEIPVSGPYWMGRIVVPVATPTGNPHPLERGRIEAFDGDGRRLGTYLPPGTGPHGNSLPAQLTRG